MDCRVCLQTGSPAWGCKVESAKLGHRRYRSERAVCFFEEKNGGRGRESNRYRNATTGRGRKEKRNGGRSSRPVQGCIRRWIIVSVDQHTRIQTYRSGELLYDCFYYMSSVGSLTVILNEVQLCESIVWLIRLIPYGKPHDPKTVTFAGSCMKLSRSSGLAYTAPFSSPESLLTNDHLHEFLS